MTTTRPGPGFLPARFLFTDETRFPDPLGIISRLDRRTGVVFRHYGAPDRLQLLARVHRICAAKNIPLMVAQTARAGPALFSPVGSAPGIHLPEHALVHAVALKQALPARPVSAAVHGLPALLRAHRTRVDFVFLSPAFSTRSHPGAHPLGALGIARIVNEVRRRGIDTPVFALGGINTGTIRRLIGTGITGIAGIEMFMQPGADEEI